jgi:hypothetical protein
MQEVATGKYHGHTFGGLNGVPPTDEIGRSVLSVRRTDATITFILLRCRWSPIWHTADIAMRPADVRFWGNSGHRKFTPPCPLMTQSGRHQSKFAVMHNAARAGTLYSWLLREL